MNCTEFQSNIYSFREGALSEELHASVFAHLASCAACSELNTAFEAMERVIESEKAAEPNPFIKTRILERIDREFSQSQTYRSSPWIRVLQPVTLAMALLCGILIGSYTAKRDNEQTMTTSETDGTIEALRTSLFIPEMTEEDKVLNLNN